MSMRANYAVKINNMEPELAQEAVEMMCKELEINLLKSTKRKMKIQIPGEHAVDVYLTSKEVTFSGDNMYLDKYTDLEPRVRQFYEAVEYSKEFNCNIDYVKESEQIELMVPV